VRLRDRSGKASQRIGFRSGDTASIRVTIRIRSFAVNLYAIEKMALPAGVDRVLKQSRR
jgi:hypothetical protein